MDEDELKALKSKLDYVAGEVHMLRAILLALIETHPDLDALSRSFEIHSQATIANAKNTLVDEHFVDLLLEISKQVKKAIEIIQARDETPQVPDPD
jgi:hypothetical protein